MRHEGIQGVLVSHGSSTVPQNVVEAINKLGGDIQDAGGISIEQLVEVSHLGIGKINVDTDIRLAVTRNIREYFLEDTARQQEPSVKGVWDLLSANPKFFDPRQYMTPLMDTMMYGTLPSEAVAELMERVKRGVKEAVGTLIVQFGSVDKASKVRMRSLEEMADYYKQEGI